MKLMIKNTSSAIIVMVLLFSLAVFNAAWLIVNWHGGPLIALAFYLVVFLLCLRRKQFQSGVIAGIIGFVIHLFELIGSGTGQLTGINQFFFYTNLILPIPLTITSYLASQNGSDGHTEQNKS